MRGKRDEMFAQDQIWASGEQEILGSLVLNTRAEGEVLASLASTASALASLGSTTSR
jgi:hypothetical protein